MSKQLPFITIAMPTYKRVRFLRQALESALNQDYPSYEIIVHDDTQDDSIRAIVESYNSGRIRYQQNRPPRGGVVPKLNDFLTMARGEWLVILCDDDALEPGYLSAIGTLAAKHPQASLVRTRFKVMDENGAVVREDKPSKPELSAYEFAARIFDLENRLFTMNITGIAFRPRTLSALGGFRPFHNGSHVDHLTWFLLGSGSPSYCDSRALCRIRQHPGSLTMADNNPDYEPLMKTNLWMQKEVLPVIERLEAGARNPSEKRLAAQCRRKFDSYFAKWVAVYDAAFEHALVSERNPMPKFRRTFDVMQALKVPIYRRVAVYLTMAVLPLPVRQKIMARYKSYRNRRTERYYARVGLGV